MFGSTLTEIKNTSGLGVAAVEIAASVDDVTVGGVAGNGNHGFTITGADNPNPGIEWAALYINGGPATAGSNASEDLAIIGNTIVAGGDSGLTANYNAAIDGLLIDGNTFSGATFAGEGPAAQTWEGSYFSAQFTTPDLPRQLVVVGGGASVQYTKDVTFTNNEVTGRTGGLEEGAGAENVLQGNTQVTLDVVTGRVEGNVFSGDSGGVAPALRVRGSDTDVIDNDFSGSNTGVQFVQNEGGEYSGNVFLDAAGNSVLSGTPGGDRFVFDLAAHGQDQILSFGQGSDKIVLQNGVANFAALDIVQVGGDTIVTTSGEQTIKLVGFASALTAADFEFGLSV